MDSSTTELALTTSPEVIRSVGFLREVWFMEDGDLRVKAMENYVSALEEEKTKIEPFKRDLSLCLQVVTDMIESLKRELIGKSGGGSHRPVLEEFLPINHSNVDDEVSVGCKRKEEKENGDKNKMDWMSSAQLWSDNYSDDAYSCATNKRTEERNGGSGEQDRQSESGDSKSKNGGGYAALNGGACLLPGCGIEEENKKRKVLTTRLPEIPLLSTGFRNSPPLLPEEEEPYHSSGSSSQGKFTAPAVISNAQQHQQGLRKARRCWSPELHRRFVSALQQLGGSHATPKQIRELMKVDGLTNDEVKSHLQKYRLHTRRIGPSSEATDEEVVVLGGGGLWVSSTSHEDCHPHHQCTHVVVSKQNKLTTGSPQSTLQFAVAAAAAARRGGMTERDYCVEESESY